MFLFSVRVFFKRAFFNVDFMCNYSFLKEPRNTRHVQASEVAQLS